MRFGVPGRPSAESQPGRNAAVLNAADAVFMLCHGVHGGDGLHPGICVSAGGIQPPGRLDVRKDPDRAAFVLSWEDVGK